MARILDRPVSLLLKYTLCFGFFKCSNTAIQNESINVSFSDSYRTKCHYIIIPLNSNMKNQMKMNKRELDLGMSNTVASWHYQYRNSAWIFIGGLNYDLTEGDVISVFSQLIKIFLSN